MACTSNVTEISNYPSIAAMCKNESLKMLGVKIIATERTVKFFLLIFQVTLTNIICIIIIIIIK